MPSRRYGRIALAGVLSMTCRIADVVSPPTVNVSVPVTTSSSGSAGVPGSSMCTMVIGWSWNPNIATPCDEDAGDGSTGLDLEQPPTSASTTSAPTVQRFMATGRVCRMRFLLQLRDDFAVGAAVACLRSSEIQMSSAMALATYTDE